MYDDALLDVSILLLLTNRYNKEILLHFCQQNGKKIAKLNILTKPAGNGLKNILGQKHFFGAYDENDPTSQMVHFQVPEGHFGLGTKKNFLSQNVFQAISSWFCQNL